MKAIHPGSLLGQRDVTQADQCDTRPTADQTGYQFARIGPNAGNGVSSDENVHESSNTRETTADELSTPATDAILD